MDGAWTAERLDDLREGMKEGFERTDAKFDKVDADVRELRGEVRSLNKCLVGVGSGLIVALIAGHIFS